MAREQVSPLKAKVRLYSHQQNIFGRKFEDVTYIAISSPRYRVRPCLQKQSKAKILEGKRGKCEGFKRQRHSTQRNGVKYTK